MAGAPFHAAESLRLLDFHGPYSWYANSARVVHSAPRVSSTLRSPIFSFLTSSRSNVICLVSHSEGDECRACSPDPLPNLRMTLRGAGSSSTSTSLLALFGLGRNGMWQACGGPCRLPRVRLVLPTRSQAPFEAQRRKFRPRSHLRRYAERHECGSSEQLREESAIALLVPEVRVLRMEIVRDRKRVSVIRIFIVLEAHRSRDFYNLS